MNNQTASGLRTALRGLRQQREEAVAAAQAAQAAHTRLAAEQAAVERRYAADDPAGNKERERLTEEKAKASAAFDAQRAAKDGLTAQEAGLLLQLELITDPREDVEQLSDATPFLLMPVRLETRFKRLAGPAAQEHELWLRIYPDDCWIESFDPVLSDVELRDVTAYWAAIWQAGGFEDQQRGAWAALVNVHGAARAAWLVDAVKPVGAAPAKVGPQDVVLTIVTTAPPAGAGEGDAIAAFWAASWAADGDAATAAAARAALDLAVADPARADELITAYRPVNYDAPLPEGVVKSGVTASAALLELPAVVTKPASWSQAPKAAILPERFVFIGYRHGEDSNPYVQIGRHVPSPLYVGPNPLAPKEEQIQHDAQGNLIVPPALQWLHDFDRAVELGMGMRIDLAEANAQGGFHRVLVLGLRIGDEEEGGADLEAHLRALRFSGSGMAVLPQGTPTNNCEDVPAGFQRFDDPDQSFDDLKAPLFAAPSAAAERSDGEWLAGYLGVDPAFFSHVHGAGATDQRATRAMNAALWPATLGYWMETMMSPVFERDTIEHTRDYFTRYVAAGGVCPSLRIGWQPYGILPTTAISRIGWLRRGGGLTGAAGQDGGRAYLEALYGLLRTLDGEYATLSKNAAFIDKEDGDPHDLLLDIVGLHSGSVDWSKRFAESLKTLINRAKFTNSLKAIVDAFIAAAKIQVTRQRIAQLGHKGEDAKILELIFSGKHLALKGALVDDAPLSETAAIRAWTDDDRNYLQWLIDASGTSLDALYRQDGFIGDKPPTALLYILLRHALQLGYHDTSIRLHLNAGLLTAAQAVEARIDDPFLHIRDNAKVSESRYQSLYSVAPAVTAGQPVPVHEYIAKNIALISFASRLNEQTAALERLKNEPTGRLERVFADHIDLCAYRLDAWLLGLVAYQLREMRGISDAFSAAPRRGIHLGAYAWLEPLRPEEKSVQPARITDPELAKIFEGEPPLTRDSANQGFVHAPSLNHAVAAAVLRNGYMSNATKDSADTLAINLSSERVRTALGMIEGVRSGQGLADLLGYQFERGLHDSHGLAEVDQYIYELRKAFPLRADKLAATKTGEGVPIQAIEARNVVDGLKLVEHIKAGADRRYPFDRTDLPDLETQAQADAINAEVDRMLETHDAVADLALSEGVYQAVLGNYDRVASTYDAYARGNFPPEPDIVRTPLPGIGLTHRVGLHLDAVADHNVSPVGGTMTPRAIGEPAVNKWLAGMFRPANEIGCMVSFSDAAADGATDETEVLLSDLALEPADWLALFPSAERQQMDELDDRIVRHVMATRAVRPDGPLTIRYMDKSAAPCSFFELMPLVRDLRRLTGRPRPLRATDLALTGEATSGQDGAPLFDKGRLDEVRAQMTALRTDITAFEAALAGPLADPEANRAAIVAAADATIADGVALLERAVRFVVPAAGWGFAYDLRRRVFTSLLGDCAALATRWAAKLARYVALRDEADASADDEEKTKLLGKAELEISTVPLDPRPATPALLRNELETMVRPPFETKLGGFVDMAKTGATTIAALLAEVQALLPVDTMDEAGFSLEGAETELVTFTQDMARVAAAVGVEIDKRLTESQTQFDAFVAAAAPDARIAALEKAAKALLGPDFRIVPHFTLAAAPAGELANALAASRSGDLFLHLTPPAGPDSFPVQTWLHGVARVRGLMKAWEQAGIFAGGLGGAEPELEAVQLPHIPGDRWWGLEFPPDIEPQGERLLYTADFTEPFDATAPLCGLLIDEWTETIPGTTADTGIAFHHDRPNNEAPQTMLLVTPTDFRGGWRWSDLVDTLNETLDLAKRRAVEPDDIDTTAYAALVPATVVANQVHQLTIAANLALNNNIKLAEAP